MPWWEEYLAPFALYFVLFAVLGLLFFLRRSRKGGASSSLASLRDVTELAREGKIDPVVGRGAEIDRIIHIISRRTKNNPLLIGEPGVGKTAIVEGLAKRIAEGDVPSFLKDKRLLELNLSELISGTKYRGEFEQRLRSLTKSLEAAPRSTILFVDEIHLLEQTKGVEGALSASDVLKPALARGDLPVIGATTFAEYEKYIRAEPALDRRFQPIFVAEPTPAAALAVLRGVKNLYEAHHKVEIDEGALEAAVSLSRKLKSRHLPDKAIDLIDEASAKVAVEAGEDHRLRLGIVHGAAKAARKHFEAEKQALEEEAKRIRALRKKFREDPALREADDVISAHLRRLNVGRKTAAVTKRPRVTKADVVAVLNEWSELAKRES